MPEWCCLWVGLPSCIGLGNILHFSSSKLAADVTNFRWLCALPVYPDIVPVSTRRDQCMLYGGVRRAPLREAQRGACYNTTRSWPFSAAGVVREASNRAAGAAVQPPTAVDRSSTLLIKLNRRDYRRRIKSIFNFLFVFSQRFKGPSSWEWYDNLFPADFVKIRKVRRFCFMAPAL